MAIRYYRPHQRGVVPAGQEAEERRGLGARKGSAELLVEVSLEPDLLARGIRHLDRRHNSYEYVAKCSVAETDYPSVLFPDIVICARLKPSLLPTYAGEVINTPLGRSYFQLNSRRAVGGMRKIGADDIANFLIPAPPLETQRQLVERIASARAEITRERAAAAKLAHDSAAEVEALTLGVRRL